MYHILRTNCCTLTVTAVVITHALAHRFEEAVVPSPLTVDESSLTPYAYENCVQNRLLVNLHHP